MSTAWREPPASATVDPENPWPGLSSYTEETRAYFHGRDEEVAELARRVQRKLLTVLFGQSGLGKTSLLRAGIVPRLRTEGHCPVYVRLDYAPESPPPAEQIKQAIFRATAEAGAWTREGSAVAGESLWEFLHHRGDLLRDADARTVVPLLIFDQFEEIFTLGQADDAGRQRAREFLGELADLVENRPPVELERRIDADEIDAGEFDFARADYRILIALREDYLAHLESLKDSMPSVTQNRMRLARMSGAQALTTVLEPGGRLVTPDVAESIVRFVAGGTELAHAEVEPSLLSLISRELNNARQAQGRTEISADLLAGSRDTILAEFYERALADQPAGVRRVIEDELLTESGHRESLAEERVAKALAAAGAAPDALAKLVDRRLLRIEERLDVRRVELTHDVLCSVVRSSRDVRQEREARDAAERQLAAEAARAAETRRTLRRTRRFAFAAGALMLVALAGAAFGWINWNRARVADEQAQRARADAERLVGFLIEDFYEELQPTGRLDTMGRLAHMAVSYYDGLPADLTTNATDAYRAMALLREAGALLARDDVENGERKLGEALAIFERLRATEPGNEDFIYGYALALFTRYSAMGLGAPGANAQHLVHASDLLRPLVQQPDAPRKVRLLYADLLNYRSHFREDRARGIADCEEARGILAGLGARELRDLTAASIYADTADSQARHSLSLGREADAEKLAAEVYAIADRVLVQRPGDLRSMANRALAANLRGMLAMRRHDLAQAEQFMRQSEQAAEDIVRFNPADLGSWVHLVRARNMLATVLEEQGRTTDAIALGRALAEMRHDPRLPASLMPILGNHLPGQAALEADAGLHGAAERTVQLALAAGKESIQQLPPEHVLRHLMPAAADLTHAGVDLYVRPKSAYERSKAALQRIEAYEIPADETFDRRVVSDFRRWGYTILARAALGAGEAAEAERAARTRIEIGYVFNAMRSPADLLANAELELADALLRQGRAGEAAALLRPLLARQEDLRRRGVRGSMIDYNHAYALYLDGSLQPAGSALRQRRLDAAAAVVRTMPGESSQLLPARKLARDIAAARATS